MRDWASWGLPHKRVALREAAWGAGHLTHAARLRATRRSSRFAVLIIMSVINQLWTSVDAPKQVSWQTWAGSMADQAPAAYQRPKFCNVQIAPKWKVQH